MALSACDRADNAKAKTGNQSSEQSLPTVEPDKRQNIASPEQASDSKYRVVEWPELIPKEDLDVLLNPPSYITDIGEGSEDDLAATERITDSGLSKEDNSSIDSNDRYQQALRSTKTIPEMDKQNIKIPGFIVPLDLDAAKKVVSFFLVPFFGACIHLPPPPPNQIIYVEYSQGINLDDLGGLYDAFWISGTLTTTLIENDLATSAYALQMQSMVPYF